MIITAYSSEETYEKAMSLGMLAFLPKPFTVPDLERIIGKALEGLEGGEAYDKHLWLTLGAGPCGLCKRNYECSSCLLEAAVMDRHDTYLFLSEDKVKELKQLSGGEKSCRYGTLRFFRKDKPYLEDYAIDSGRSNMQSTIFNARQALASLTLSLFAVGIWDSKQTEAHFPLKVENSCSKWAYGYLWPWR